MDLKIAGADGDWSHISWITRTRGDPHQGCAGSAIEHVQPEYVFAGSGLTIVDGTSFESDCGD
jgi:hypothetical protein